MLPYLIAILALMGTLFMLLATIGLLRMPDLFLRISTTAKAGTLGVGLMLVAAVIYFGDFAITTRAVATIIFIMLTAPVAAHMIARAAYFDGAPLWDGTIQDELRGHYHTTTHELDSQVSGTPDTSIEPEEGDDFQVSG